MIIIFNNLYLEFQTLTLDQNNYATLAPEA